MFNLHVILVFNSVNNIYIYALCTVYIVYIISRQYKRLTQIQEKTMTATT